MLAWLGRVVVRLVGVIDLHSGLTVYRGRKTPEANKQATHGICAMQPNYDDMSSLTRTKTSPEYGINHLIELYHF